MLYLFSYQYEDGPHVLIIMDNLDEALTLFCERENITDYQITRDTDFSQYAVAFLVLSNGVGVLVREFDINVFGVIGAF